MDSAFVSSSSNIRVAQLTCYKSTTVKFTRMSNFDATLYDIYVVLEKSCRNHRNGPNKHNIYVLLLYRGKTTALDLLIE